MYILPGSLYDGATFLSATLEALLELLSHKSCQMLSSSVGSTLHSVSKDESR